jgi:hypothetical protein
MSNLTLHKGSKRVPVEFLSEIIHPGEIFIDGNKYIGTPEPTASHIPIPHFQVQELVKGELVSKGYQITAEQHALGRFGQRYFGILQVVNAAVIDDHPDFTWTVGIRNSHDKAFPAAMAAGTKVMVCDNLAFSGSIKIAHKHTAKVLDKLPDLVYRGVERLRDEYQVQLDRVQAYKEFPIKDSKASLIIMKAFEKGLVSTTKIAPVWEEWLNPRHESFQERNAWSLFNAFTEVIKQSSLWSIFESTTNLHQIFDAITGISDNQQEVENYAG